LASFDANNDRAPDADRTILLPAMNKTPATPHAVIGMACRLPGGIESPDQPWEALLRGDDPVTEIPPDRWDADEDYDPEPAVPGRSVSRWGAFCDDVAGFDPEFFGINQAEATAIDPQHRLLLETSRKAMEHAGLTPQTMADSLTGVFVGSANWSSGSPNLLGR
jgi:polyketide synthase 5